MFPAAFDYHAPRDLSEAIATLARLGPDAKILAGGCSLIPLMKLRLAEPAHLVDLRRIEELRGFREDGDRLVIGAMTREAEVESSPAIARHAPLLAETSRVIADPLVRNMGTIGGTPRTRIRRTTIRPPCSRSTPPWSSSAPMGGARSPARTSSSTSSRPPLATARCWPRSSIPFASAADGHAYVKIERQVGDFAVVGAAVRLRVRDGEVTDAAIALTNVGSVALRARDAERSLIGGSADEAAFRRAGEAAVDAIDPWDEQRAARPTSEHLVPVAVRRALSLAASRAGAAHV